MTTLAKAARELIFAMMPRIDFYKNQVLARGITLDSVDYFLALQDMANTHQVNADELDAVTRMQLSTFSSGFGHIAP